MKVHRAPPFLRAYRFLPHRLLNRAALRLARARRPRFLVAAVIRAWIRRSAPVIDMSDFVGGNYETIEDFFLRRLRPGARPIGEGIVSPVDGIAMAVGVLDPGRPLVVKGRPISVERLVNGTSGDLPLAGYLGGAFVVLFLSPDGYHRIHAPASGTLDRVNRIPGRFFPQNDDALRHIDRIYESNERVALRLALAGGGELLLVLVGASLVGGIELTALSRPVAAGAEIGHFRFGSTVVLLLPGGVSAAPAIRVGDHVRMGQTLFT